MPANQANHTIPTHFPNINGELVVGGRPLSAIAQSIDSDSFYLYDSQQIAQRVSQLKAALPKKIGIHYAIKANPFRPVVNFISGLLDGLDVASAAEMHLALDAGMSPQKISFAGPGKTEADLIQAVAAGILLNIESPREAEALATINQRLGLAARVALRINPAFELRGSGMRMGGGPRPFGVDEEEAPTLLAKIGTLGLAFEGLHIYAGSQNLQSAEIASAQKQSYALALRLAEYAPAVIKTLNLGGGFGIPYFPGEQALSLTPIADALTEIVLDANKNLPQAQVHLELGRYLIGEAGLYVTKVIDKKISRGTTYLITAGGMNHHLAASGNLGQVIRKNYPVAIGNRMDSTALETVSIHGSLCTPLDILAERVTLPRAEVGDWVVLFQSGAYGASASPQGFLSQPLAKEMLL